MLKSLHVLLASAVALGVRATPIEVPAVTESTKFTGSFDEDIVGSLAFTTPAGSSLERRQFGSTNGFVILCSGKDCFSNCFQISTSGGDSFGKCEFTVPNPFFSFGLTNPPTGTFYPFTIGINLGPASCPNNLFQLDRANVCFNINTSSGGNGWTFEAGDISIVNQR